VAHAECLCGIQRRASVVTWGTGRSVREVPQHTELVITSDLTGDCETAWLSGATLSGVTAKARTIIVARVLWA
jgi:hypothetical protein